MRTSNNQAHTRAKNNLFPTNCQNSRKKTKPSNQISEFLKNQKLKVFHWSIKKNNKNANILGLRAFGGKCAAAMKADRSEQSRMTWSKKKISNFHQITR